MNHRKAPNWLLIALGVLAVIFLGPPLLGLALGAVGLFMGLMTFVVKVGVVVVAIYALAMLMRGLLGRTPTAAAAVGPRSTGTIDAMHFDLEREDRSSLAELDRELEKAIQKKGGSGQ